VVHSVLNLANKTQQSTLVAESN